MLGCREAESVFSGYASFAGPGTDGIVSVQARALDGREPSRVAAKP
jgi:hypothetical protein